MIGRRAEAFPVPRTFDAEFAIPLAVVAGAVAVEVVMLVRRLLARRTAHD